jgi:hypothetical protein
MTQRFLKLIAGINSKSDINPQHIEQVLGVPIAATGDSDGSHVYRGQFNDGIEYSIVYYPGPIQDNLAQHPSVAFSRIDGACIISFASVKNSIVIKGVNNLIPTENRTNGGQRSSWWYREYPTDFWVKIGASGQYRYGRDQDKDCITNFLIEATRSTR